MLLACFWISLLWANGVAAQTPLAQPALAQALAPANDPPQSFRVLCYHDIRDNLRETFKTQPEATAIDSRDFINQLNWLHENGYQPVSLQQIVDARAGRGKLPKKAILLTFDDGYKSLYTKVFPLLKQFNFPVVAAIVGSWLETPDDELVAYGDQRLTRDQFVSWQELREMAQSGLVEVASHSHGLHQGIQANPQGNLVPAAIARRYSAQEHRYETDTAYAARIRADLQRNAALIERQLGRRPRAMVWPYGMYNLEAIEAAQEAGMPVTMNLEPGPNTPGDALSRVRRTLLTYDTSLAGLIALLRQPASYGGDREPLERVIHVDLDYVYDPDPAVQEANLSKLLDRMKRLRPTTVYLQAYGDQDGDGIADSLYFPNRHLPMRADLFSRVAWQLRTRVGVRVYAWMPVMAYKLPAGAALSSRLVEVMPDAPAAATQGRYHRLTPFDPAVRKLVAEIYEDLGKHAVFQGILFHDDATFSDYEDASAAARAVYRAWGLPDSLEAIRQDPVLRQRWAEQKSGFLNDYTVSLANTLRKYHPAILTARNLYAEPVRNAAAQEWFAQSLPGFLATYDFTAVMAMPYMEGAADPELWLDALIGKVKAVPGALRKTVFELQSRDWRTGQAVPSATLAAQLRQLRLQGARNVGYYPDDFHADQPEESLIKPVISAETEPAWR